MLKLVEAKLSGKDIKVCQLQEVECILVEVGFLDFVGKGLCLSPEWRSDYVHRIFC